MLDEVLSIIAQNVKEKRQAQGMTIKELSEKAGISFSTISAIENERCNNITLDKLEAIAAALNVDFLSIVSQNEVKKSQSSENIDEEEYIKKLKNQVKLEAYYPPIHLDHKISSMLELFLILPLIDLDRLYDANRKIADISVAEANGAEEISSIFDSLWDEVQMSPAKRYVERVLDEIRAIRNGEQSYDGGADILNKEGFEDYRELVAKKMSAIDAFGHLENLFSNKGES